MPKALICLRIQFFRLMAARARDAGTFLRWWMRLQTERARL